MNELVIDKYLASSQSCGMCLGFRESKLTEYNMRWKSKFLLRGSFPQTQVSPLYFDREDVKKTIHAPVDVDWVECSNIDVFPDGDASLPPAFTVLPSVIERSKRAVIVHGLGDFILIAEG